MERSEKREKLNWKISRYMRRVASKKEHREENPTFLTRFVAYRFQTLHSQRLFSKAAHKVAFFVLFFTACSAE